VALVSAPRAAVGRNKNATSGRSAALRNLLGASRFAAAPDWAVALAVGIAGAAALALVGSLMPHETVPRGDDEIYERMAQHPFATHTFPFAYRIGLPWLVHVLPFTNTASFELLAYLAAGAAAATAYLLMRHFAAVRGLAAGLAFALALSPPVLIVALREGRNTDIATIFLMLLATLFVVRRSGALLAVALALGVLVRESELFIVPLAYAVWAERWWDPAAAKRVLLCSLPAIAIYAGLHIFINSVGEAKVPGYGGSLVGQRFTVIKTGLDSAAVEARRMLLAFGPLWIAAPLALAGMRFARRGLVLVVACLLSMTFALDWGRMIFLAAPVFYPAGAYTLTAHARWRRPALVLFAAIIAGYAIYMAHSGVRTGIIDNPLPSYPIR
jgi:hypothetical protein